MPQILMAIGVLCLLYFLILLVKSVDFCMIWLPISGLFLASGGYWAYVIRHPDGFRIPNVILIIAGMIIAVGLVIFVIVEAMIIREMYRTPEPDLEYVIVLGAQVRGERPSKALNRRLEAAAEYLLENPQTKAVLSGGQGPGEDITEAECMYRYLREAGIEKERLLLEDESTSTLENLQFSAEVIEMDGNISAFESKVGILSNNFHVYRALRLGEKMGYEDFYGIAARSDWHLQIHYLVREFFALIKEKMMGNI